MLRDMFVTQVDLYGELADTYADLGDLELAAENYDLCIAAINEAPSGIDCQ